MPNLSLFKIPGTILAHAKGLILGGEPIVPPVREPDASFAPKSDATSELGATAQDRSFWASVTAADRRLADLRRAIDEAAAEAMTREANAEASLGEDAHLGESRYDAANRVISDALGAEKS